VDDVKELCTAMAIINHGKILMHGNPLEAIAKVEGKVWKKRIHKTALVDYERDYHVISNKLIAGQPEIHVLSDTQPGEGFLPTSADLEDVYFSYIHASNTASTPVTA
jgi:ABC-type multidrug transport system ATPase subunit